MSKRIGYTNVPDSNGDTGRYVDTGVEETTGRMVKQSGPRLTYEAYTSTMRILKDARNHLRAQRGTGDCAQAIARNQAISLLNDAEWRLIGEYIRRAS